MRNRSKCAGKSKQKKQVALSMPFDMDNLSEKSDMSASTLQKYQLQLILMGNPETPRYQNSFILYKLNYII